ncbi:unnamed protein product [Brassica rapa subsp. narinosa]
MPSQKREKPHPSLSFLRPPTATITEPDLVSPYNLRTMCSP